jgi:hypothetical protein
MSFNGHKFLASKDYNISISCHIFLVLCWNLIARCVSVGSLMYDHVSWNFDSMVVVFPSDKSGKEGKDALSKHVYANVAGPHFAQSHLMLFISLLGDTTEEDRKQVFFLERQRVGFVNGYINRTQIAKKYWNGFLVPAATENLPCLYRHPLILFHWVHALLRND